jgi:oxygen-dependent protoporphyrinogen oxidase
MSSRSRVAVVGAGISGLATAYYLLREAEQKGTEVEIHLLEKSGRLGGVINTERSDGFLFEWGPENFVPFKPEAVRLAKELGLENELIGSNDDRRQTFVVSQGQIRALPDGMAFLAPVRFGPFMATSWLSMPGKLRALLEPLVPKSRGDLTVRHFLERRLGKELTSRVTEPLVSAIYGGDIDQLSMMSALPDTYRIEQKHGSLWNGLRKSSRTGGVKLPFFMTLRSGMETLVKGLTQALGRVRMLLQVEDLSLSTSGRQFQLSARGFSERYDGVVLAVPADAAASLLGAIAPESAEALASIHYSSTSLVYLAYKRAEFSHPLTGFGFVTPKDESEVLDACTWVSTKYEDRCPPDSVLLRCAIHDGRRARAFPSDEALAEKIQFEVARLLSISCRPTFYRVAHLGRSMPQMTVGHAAKIRLIEEAAAQYPGLYLTGPFYSGVGVPDCIRSGHNAARRFLGERAHADRN